jgi:hypothetical protein
MMYRVTNNGTAPRGVFAGGLKFIAPGQFRDVALSAQELADVRAEASLTVEPVPAPSAVVEPVAPQIVAKTAKKANT